MGSFGAEALPAIKHRWKDPVPSVCAAAVSSLCQFSIWHRLVLVSYISHPDESVRKWAKVGLHRNSKSSIAFLETAATTWDPVGLNARAILARMGRGKPEIHYIRGSFEARKD